jgi:hypothetical protein
VQSSNEARIIIGSKVIPAMAMDVHLGTNYFRARSGRASGAKLAFMAWNCHKAEDEFSLDSLF